jgi:hypothetical protein
MEWWDIPKPEFPKNVIFTAGESGNRAKKKKTRQQIYIHDSFFDEQLPSKWQMQRQRQKQKKKPQPKFKPKPKLQEPPPQPQQPHNEIITLSASERPWPHLKKTITVYPPPELKFGEDTHTIPKPSWYKLLLPYFQHLAPCAASYVPSSSYMNIRLHALNDILHKKFFSDKQPSPFAEWLLGQTLRILIPMLRVRRLFRQFIQVYRCRKCDARAEQIDPFTLCKLEPQDAIRVYCLSTKKRYDYDPISIVRHVSTSLRYQNSGFADVRTPKLPQTNEPFTPWQLTSIYDQARKRGIVSQTFTNYRSVQWSLHSFANLFSHDLQKHAIRNEHLALDSFIARENITYWIEMSSMTEGIYLEDDDFHVIQYGLDNYPTHSYLSAWKGIIMNYLTLCNIFPNSNEQKALAKNNFHKKCVQLLRLFCDFRHQMRVLRDVQESSEEDASSQDE